MSDEATGEELSEELSEEPLRCHYCGADCDVEGGDGYAYVACGNIQCNATGPNHPAPELCRDAHRRVMPAPVWTKAVPFEGDEVWHRCNSRDNRIEPQIIKFLYQFVPCLHCEFAPVVRTAEPAEGGAK